MATEFKAANEVGIKCCCCWTCAKHGASSTCVEPSRQMHPDNPILACNDPQFTLPGRNVRAGWFCEWWGE